MASRAGPGILRTMKTLLVCAALLMAAPAVAAPPAGPPPPSPAAEAAMEAAARQLVAWGSPESNKRFARSKHNADFFKLANQFESQHNLGYCGPASATIVLNALRLDNAKAPRPRDETTFPPEYIKGLPPGLDPVFKRYTQNTFFDAHMAKVKTRDQFFGAPRAPGARPSPGIELRELHNVLLNHGLKSELRVMDDTITDKQLRQELLRNLATAGDYVIINYSRVETGQGRWGHMSPLGAYDQKSDSFLVMDVNPNQAGWAWVPAALLAKAMRTKDVAENRGYLLVAEGTQF